VPYDYCETSDQLSTRADDGWLSCDPGDNPYVSERSSFHWIHYDFGATYMIGSSRIWNYNVPGETDQGFQQVAVDYSIDGVTWFHLGDYTWPLAPGISNYTGFDGPDFQQVEARYIMFTSLDDPSVCRGISKATFVIDACSARGTTCDDGRSDTFQDHINATCQCEGYTIEELDCAIDTLLITQDDMSPETYHAISALMSSSRVLEGGDLHYRAGMEIVLEAGFEVERGALMDADIEDCPDELWSGTEGQKFFAIADVSEKSRLLEAPREPNQLEVYSLDGRPDQTIHMHLKDPARVTLDVYDSSSNLITRLVHHYYQDHGDHYKRIQTKKLPPGIYTVKMFVEGASPLSAQLIIKGGQVDDSPKTH